MGTLAFSLLFFTFIFQILFSVSGQCLNDQKSKLLQLKESLQCETPTKLAQWNSSTDCCTWTGVSCDALGFVTSLELDSQFIFNATENWKILFTLSNLEKLNLAFNFFYPRKIPDELQNLKNLKVLNLSNAGFVGQIPLAVSTMKNLVILDLSTSFPGLVEFTRLENPDLKTLVQNLTELRELHLDGVNISAQGKDWCNTLLSLSNLRVLSLAHCHISGPICSSLSELSSLSVIRLDGNNISSTVPEVLANFSNLTTLSLSSSNVHGKFPENILQVPTLQYLDLSGNELITGTLPQFPKSASFRTIILTRTKFSGFLPDSIGNLRALSSIDMSDCNFSGPIPSSMSGLRELIFLDLSFNSFNGSIPSFQMSKKLTYIDLSRNHLKGSISSNHFQGLQSLVKINLDHNSLTGAIPPSLFALPSLQELVLSNNQFRGQLLEFPNASASLLDTVDLSSNHIEGPIPESFFKLERLEVLSLSFNLFNGTIKFDSFKKLQNLMSLELSYNNLSIDATCGNETLSSFPKLDKLSLAACNLSNIPYHLKNESRIFHLDLSVNHITGEIPSWIWEVGNGTLSHLNLSRNLLSGLQENYTIPSLSDLDLHANLLQGKMPIPPESAWYVDYSSNHFNTSFPENISIPRAYFFSISNNRFTGVVPESICNLNFTIVLDLSNNAFSGSIPSCLLKLESSVVLNLSKNKLSGTITDTFPVNCALQTLDLSENALEGKIPRSLDNCMSLQVLNVRNNNIEDTFPCTLLKAPALHVMVLRSNRFYGDLQCTWAKGNWTSLQIMDIACNDFSGTLPSELFSDWRGLMIVGNSQPKPETQDRVPVLSKVFYQDRVELIIKGVELELVKILITYASIDFSCNKFHGVIPDVVGQLKALYILNFSHNAFTGSIPLSFGNLTQLESLDLSTNQLSGKIPTTLGSLTFLSFLNLSFNQLSGRIPEGRQLQTFSNTSFLGNPRLCGFQLNISCDDRRTKVLPKGDQSERHSQKEIDWEYVSAGLGFAVSLGITCWLILLSPRCSSLVDQVLVRILHEQVKGRVYGNPIPRA